MQGIGVNWKQLDSATGSHSWVQLRRCTYHGTT